MYITITPAQSAGVTETPTPSPPTAARSTMPATITSTRVAITKNQCFRVIALEALHIRSEPSEKSKVVGYARFGQRLTMIQAGAWSKIQTTDQLTGYVNSKYIQEGCP
jgi:uncharacterized protein YgiM (DUF1202 family)